MHVFKLATKSLVVEQTQSMDSYFIHELKNIFITFVSVTIVTEGQLTLDMMLSVQHIIGQLNAPVLQIVDFIRSIQDDKIGLEHLGEIHDKEDEELLGQEKEATILNDKDLIVKELHFRYTGGLDNEVLSGINLTIPKKISLLLSGLVVMARPLCSSS
ncbi:MAG: hypothetical protein ABI045_06305 [Flavobacteriales bacterium]